MSHELGDALGQGFQQGKQVLGVVAARHLEASEPVGGPAAMAFEHSMESPSETVHRPARHSHRQWNLIGRTAEGEIHRAPDPRHVVLFTQPCNLLQYGRQQVRVLVGVEMGKGHARCHDFLNL